MSTRTMRYDVAVVGGGTAGVAAAVGAAQAGARTILCEKIPYLGGQITHCTLPAFCGFFTQGEQYEQAVAGVGQQVLDVLHSMGVYEQPVIVKANAEVACPVILVEPEPVKFALDQVVTQAKVDTYFHTSVIGAAVHNNRIDGIECIDDQGRFEVRADSFVDATGDANLTALAGGGCVVGDEDGHLQAATMMIRIGGIPVSIQVDSASVNKAVVLAKAAGVTSLTKEFGVVLRMPSSQEVILNLADEEIGGFDAASLSRAEFSGRKQAWAYLEALRRFIPGCENAFVSQTGPKIGVRESRHILGDYTLTVKDLQEASRHPDAIARAAWPGEDHCKAGEPDLWYPIFRHSYFDIPLRAIRVKGLTNLWAAGRTISCDPIAFVSVRVNGTAFATGHAAGVAAALSLQSPADAAPIRRELIRQNALL